MLASSQLPQWLLYTGTAGVGIAATWVSMRLSGALVWRTNAEGYKAEMERQAEEHTRQVEALNDRLTVLAKRIQEQDEVIRQLQTKTDVVPLLEISRDIKAILDGRTDIIMSIKESEESRRRENEQLFADLRTSIFPAIEAIHRAVMPRENT